MTAFFTALLLCAYVATSVGGLVLLKLEGNYLSARFLLGVLLYGTGFLLWYALLRILPLSLAFPLAAGCLIVGTQLAGKFILHERVDPTHLVGIALVIVGIVVLSMREFVSK